MSTDDTSWLSLDTMVGPITGRSVDVEQGSLGQASIQSVSPVWHPDHPLAWGFAIAAVAVGLAGVSTHLRVGPVKAGVDAGHT